MSKTRSIHTANVLKFPINGQKTKQAKKNKKNNTHTTPESYGIHDYEIR
jgi:hypothetical protein